MDKTWGESNPLQLMYTPTTAHTILYKALYHTLEILLEIISIESENVIQDSMSRDVRIMEIKVVTECTAYHLV